MLECSHPFAVLLCRSLLAAVKRAVGFLLAVGANPNARYAVKATDDPVLMLAVFAAANFGDWGFVEMLLRHGADPDARSGAIAVGWLQRIRTSAQASSSGVQLGRLRTNSWSIILGRH